MSFDFCWQAMVFEKVAEVLLKIVDDDSEITTEEEECFDRRLRVLSLLTNLMDEDIKEDAKSLLASMGINQVNDGRQKSNHSSEIQY